MMNFLDSFEDVRSRGANTSQWDAKCRAHDDDHHSLQIGRSTDRWLLHCSAGCWIGKVLACHNLDWNDLFDDPARANGNGNGRISLARAAATKTRPKLDMSGDAMMPPAHIIEHWQRQLSDELQGRLRELKGWHELVIASSGLGWDGVRITIPVYGPDQRLASLVRYLPGGDPKTLCIGRRELYPAPETFDFDQRDLWLVEGEPDRISGQVLCLSTVGIPGVGKFNDSWPERFAGRRVTVCLDCDVPGRETARKWASAFSSLGIEHRVVDLDPSRLDGFDVGDALAAASKQGRVPDLKAYLARLHTEAWRE